MSWNVYTQQAGRIEKNSIGYFSQWACYIANEKCAYKPHNYTYWYYTHRRVKTVCLAY